LGRDQHGYILTGDDIALQDNHRWPLDRPAMLLETSLPGVFAAGDVRYGSVKRVASAVGNGASQSNSCTAVSPSSLDRRQKSPNACPPQGSEAPTLRVTVDKKPQAITTPQEKLNRDLVGTGGKHGSTDQGVRVEHTDHSLTSACF